MDPVNQWDLSGKFIVNNALKWINKIFGKSAPQQPIKTTGPSAAGGYLHWLNGRGRSLSMPANSMKWVIKSPLSPGRYDKQSVDIRSAGNFDQKYHVGRATGSFTGVVTGDRIKGTMTINPNQYHFRPGTSREQSDEDLTTLGRRGGIYYNAYTYGLGGPIDYDMYFTGGSVEIDQKIGE